MKINSNEIKSAKRIVQTTQNNSISFLQRKMGVSYEKARRLMGIVEKELAGKNILF